MPVSRPNAALANLPVPPPLDSIQFFDGYYPALDANAYTISLTHTVSGNAGAPARFKIMQTVTVQGPEFTIDPGIVQSVYPPNGASNIYGQKLPFIILTDPSLPWERSLIPNQGLPDPANPASWMALLVFASNEIELQPGTNNPVSTTTVANLLAVDPNVLKPQLPAGWVSQTVLNSQCQMIQVPGAVFNAVVPTTADLPYLTHCRGVNTLSEGEQLLSVVLANRLPQAANPSGPVQYFANLVSLEGFAAYMGPNPTPIPTKPDSTELMDVQIVSLFNWSFTSLPEAGLSFENLMEGLIASQQDTSTQQSTVALQLPLPSATTVPANVQDRIDQGFVALDFVTGAAEDSFAWYRGPFTAVVPQTMPQVGNPSTPVGQAANADVLMIYLAEQGLFDLSYAAAWNIGRNLGLADATFANNVTAYRNAVASSFTALAQRSAMSHFAGVSSPKAMLARDATRRRFTEMMGQGLGEQWTAALRAVRTRGRTSAPVSRPRRRFNLAATAHPRLAMAAPQAVDAVSSYLAETIESVAAWLARLSLLYPVPFTYLVPDPRMLPVESIRFFYVDPAWIDALVAGALSIAVHSSADIAAQTALMPAVRSAVDRHRAKNFRRTRPDAAINYRNAAGNVTAAAEESGNGVSMAGVLIRSQLVSGWPSLVVTASVGGAPLNLVRDDCPSSTVRLCLFDGIPDTVTLAEPYQGLLFGVEDQGVFPRCVTAPAFTGSQIANGSAIAPTFRTPPAGSQGGVLNVQPLAADLEPAVGLVPFDSSAQVNWNGTPLTTIYVSAQQLAATVPASLVTSPGIASISVTSGGATSLPQALIVNAALEIDSINPAMTQAGGNGFTLAVNGVGFASSAQVNWNGSPLGTTFVSANQLTAVVPASWVATPSSATITVVNGGTSNAVTLSIVSADPAISSIAPNVAVAGGTSFTLTISGSAFAKGAQVQWNGTGLTTAFINDQQLKASVSASLIAAQGSASVTVLLLNGAVSNAVSFTITNASPTIGSIAPSVALAGGDHQFTLVVDGVNFADDAVVVFNGTSITPTTSSVDQLTATVPASLVTSPGLVDVAVQSGGVTSNTMPFLVVGLQPAVGLLDPPEVIAGSAQFTLTVYGGFGAGDFALQMVAAPEMQSFPTT